MRLYILRALLAKEVRRHLANRGGLALAGLLVVAALLLTIFKPTGGGGVSGGELIGGVPHCYIEFVAETNFIRELRARQPDEIKPHLVFREQPPQLITGPINYETGSGAIRVIETTHDGSPTGTPVIRFEVWHPPESPTALAAYELWFFRTAHTILRERAAAKLGTGDALRRPDLRDDDLWAEEEAFRTLDAEVERLKASGAGRVLPKVFIQRHGLGAKPLDYRSAVATAMVVFALYFTCCYLLPTLNCEERERGVLLAQALSPASPVEIVAAKFLFYPLAGIALAAALAGIYNVAVLGSLFFWLSLLAMACGFLGIGMTVSTLAKTQRGAFMGSMAYLLCVSLLLFVCGQAHVPLLPHLAIESHGPKILHAAMTGEVDAGSWVHLLAAGGLASGWMALAGWLFRKRGWQ
ncbi:MAG: ABC transporter permease [Fimbriiglobus sp.]|jgi:hypothetical protein|nr:ABC transporter permease [Fimbriiglobus sp.]